MKPLLAATLKPEDITSLAFPVYASPKLDGIRCLISEGKALSRTLKPIPNEHVQAWASKWGGELAFTDGELIVGEHDEGVFNRTQSCVMSIKGEPAFTYWVFDEWQYPEETYGRRFRSLIENAVANVPNVKLVPRKLINNSEELLEYEHQCLSRGFEGVMLRSPSGKYKHGRSTLKEAILLKLKRFTDSEAICVDTEERMHNSNPATKSETGATKRSSHQQGMQPCGDLGALVVQGPEGQRFSIGTGFTAQQRIDLWKIRDTLIGKQVKYKHFEHGSKDAPRFPVFISFRHEDDMSA